MSEQERGTDAVLAERLTQAEEAVLGSMLIDSDVVGCCLQQVGPETFVTARYRTICAAIKSIYSEGKLVDPILVNDRLGGNYNAILAHLMEMTPTSANWEAYTDLLRRSSALYRLHELGDALARAEDAEAAQTVIDAINAGSGNTRGMQITTMRAAYDSFLDRHADGRRPAYLTWGIPSLDERIYAEPGDFVVLGGYPSAGKTALALSMASHIAKAKKVGYFYSENNDRKLFDRLVSATALVSFGKIKRYDLSESDFESITSVQGRLLAPQLEFVAAAGHPVQDIRALALSRHYDLVVVDYLQKIRGSRRRDESDFERVSAISSDLQQMGQQTGITVLALSQLSRPERKNGTTPAPGMHSFRQSGQIEQDADIALLLYKEDDSQPASPRILKIGKNKDGVAGVAMRMSFDGDTQTFSRFTEQEAPPTRRRQRPPQVNLFEGWTVVDDEEAASVFSASGGEGA